MDLEDSAWSLCETAMEECRNKELIVGLKAEVEKLKAENDTFTSCIVESNDTIADLRKALKACLTAKL